MSFFIAFLTMEAGFTNGSLSNARTPGLLAHLYMEAINLVMVVLQQQELQLELNIVDLLGQSGLEQLGLFIRYYFLPFLPPYLTRDMIIYTACCFLGWFVYMTDQTSCFLKVKFSPVFYLLLVLHLFHVSSQNKTMLQYIAFVASASSDLPLGRADSISCLQLLWRAYFTLMLSVLCYQQVYFFHQHAGARDDKGDPIIRDVYNSPLTARYVLVLFILCCVCLLFIFCVVCALCLSL